MPFEHEPEPSGKRLVPPGHIRVTLDDFEGSGSKVAMISVGDLFEETALVNSFESRGWEVRLADGMIDAIAVVDHEGVKMVVTDDFDLIGCLRSTWNLGRPPVFVALFTWHEDTYRYAKSAGADAALTRPLDLKDPLAFFGFDVSG
jgi:hypothetical protein